MVNAYWNAADAWKKFHPNGSLLSTESDNLLRDRYDLVKKFKFLTSVAIDAHA